MIQRKTVRGDPAADMHADCGHLLAIHPHAGAAWNSPGRVARASASSTALIMPLSSGPKKAAAMSTYSVTATRAGTSLFHYTEDPGLGHDVWSQNGGKQYRLLPDGGPMYDWLFAQTSP